MWWATGCIRGGGSIRACEVGIDVISPVKQHCFHGCHMAQFGSFGLHLAIGCGCGGFEQGWVEFEDGRGIVGWLGVHGGWKRALMLVITFVHDAFTQGHGGV